MNLIINDKEYPLKLNLKARIKIQNYFGDEYIALEKAYKGDTETLFRIIYFSLQDNDFTFEEFLKYYPSVIETVEVMKKLFAKLTKEAGNPFDLPQNIKHSKDKKENTKIDFRELIITLMSKGYTQDEVLDMTYWDINLIFEADYKKLEREAIHTNAIINTIASIVGNKKPIDILGRKKKEEYRDITLFKNITEILDRK